MNKRSSHEVMSGVSFGVLFLLTGLLAAPQMVNASEVVSVNIKDTPGKELAPHFLGLSYEIASVNPEGDQYTYKTQTPPPAVDTYYFDAKNTALVQLYKTLGVKSLRVGANAVDHGKFKVPQEKDIDALFAFARAAGVKVIYSFKLRKGDPAESARLAAYIAKHYSDALDCFAMGNEPAYHKTYPEYIAAWKPHYDAILKAVPTAKFNGPSANGLDYGLKLANDLFSEGHLAMVSEHFYPMGNGRDVEKDLPASFAQFLKNDTAKNYPYSASSLEKLKKMGVPYRIDEMNSCFYGGAKGVSDAYASTLWGLDYMHWWAQRGIEGLNFHTGELVGMNGGFNAPNYAVFLRCQGGFNLHPLGYAFLAFTQGAKGRSLSAEVKTPGPMTFTVYGFKEKNGTFLVTLNNKTFGDSGQDVKVSVHLPETVTAGRWERLDLVQKNHDVAATSGVLLGGSPVTPAGIWSGKWAAIPGEKSGQIEVVVPKTSAAILRFTP